MIVYRVPAKKKNVKRRKNMNRRLEPFLITFQLVSFTLIIMNITLFSNVLYNFFFKNIIQSEYDVLYISVMSTIFVVNILEVMNNWASIVNYNMWYRNARHQALLYGADLITLAIFYIQIHILTKIFDNFSDRIGETTLQITVFVKDFCTESSLTFVISSILINMLYSGWNILILFEAGKHRDKKNEDKTMTVWHGVIFRICILLLFIKGFIFSANQEWISNTTLLYVTVYVYSIINLIFLVFSQKIGKTLIIILNTQEAGI